MAVCSQIRKWLSLLKPLTAKGGYLMTRIWQAKISLWSSGCAGNAYTQDEKENLSDIKHELIVT